MIGPVDELLEDSEVFMIIGRNLIGGISEDW